jgi:hypothetical protein
VTFADDVAAIVIDRSKADDAVKSNVEAFATKIGIKTGRYISVPG